MKDIKNSFCELQREINNINSKISRIAKKGRNCCGLSQRQCSECFKGIWDIKDLKDKKERLYNKLHKLKYRIDIKKENGK